jgi:hypothetical protein
MAQKSFVMNTSRHLAITALFFACVISGDSQSVTFSPLNTTVNNGDLFSINIVGQDFTVANLPVGGNGFLDGGGINLTYDKSVVEVTSILIAAIWDPAFSFPPFVIDNSVGSASPVNFGTASACCNGDFDIATIAFHAVGLGTSQLRLTENADNPFGSGGIRVPVAFGIGSVTVVPEISSGWMLGLGLILWGLSRKMLRC